MERFRILDHGCKVNRYDGELVRAELRRFGLTESPASTEPDRADPADLVVLNACAVTDHAVKKGRKALRRLRRENPGARMIVTGCMTSPDRVDYERIEPGVLTVPSGERDGIRAALVDFLGDAVSVRPEGELRLDPHAFESRHRAFLKVEDGCDAKCAFCVIPSIRGSVRSRSRADVLDEARRLIDRELREVVLCGVHLGHYGRDTGDSVIGLAKALADLQGSFRVRLSSLEISEVDAQLARTLADTERLTPHLHVPLQSGDDDVLRRMRRPYSSGRYLERIATVRDAVPDLSLTTDLIVGFPGETDAAFERTLQVARSAGFSRIHAFPFSPRAGTEAAQLPDRVPTPILRERVARLLDEDAKLRLADDTRRIGSAATVLIESASDQESQGLSERYRRIRLPGHHSPSTFVRCRLVGRVDDDLRGEACA